MRSFAIVALMFTAIAATAATAGCGTAKPGGMSGPSMNNRMGDDPPPPALQSNTILARDQVTPTASVQHILIGWRGHGDESRQDERAKARSRVQSETLVKQIFAQLQNGAPMEPLMKQYSEDPGSRDGRSYDVEAGSQFVFEFRRLAMRLNVGELGIVMSDFGWHIMKRIK